VIWERLGRTYELLQDPEAAEAAYRTAVDLPKGAIALVSLGRFLIHAGRLQEAGTALAQALERHPQGEVQIRMEIAELQRRLGRPAAALDELLQLSTGRVPPRSTLAAAIDARIAEILVEHDHLTRALPHLTAALAQLPDDRALRTRLEEVQRRLADGPAEKLLPLENAPIPAQLASTLSFESERLVGRVETYFPERGFGFIRFRESETIFFHVSHCQGGADQQMAVGVEVSFVCGVNHRNGKPQAEQIRTERPTAQAAAAGRGRGSTDPD
jgi:cold shock CspA family protein/thioredoxin-like negative regulator of GroEL